MKQQMKTFPAYKSHFPLNLLVILITLLFSSCSRNPVPPENPNFLFILVDDLGYFDLGFQGSDYYETPNIDELAQRSMIFTNGYAACQVCSPSRATIMTGQFPDRHGITDYIGAPMGERWNTPNWGEPRGTQMLPATYHTHLPHENVVLPEAMKEAGYTTFFAGKWHLGDRGSFPEDHGFDINKGGNHRGSPASGRFFSPFGNEQLEDGPDGESLTMRLGRETSEFIRQHQDEKFFAYMAFYAVHAPLQTTREYWSQYRDRAEEQGIAKKGYAMEKRFPIRIEQDNPVYAGMVKTVDDAVGMVLNALEDCGLSEKTVVIFTSDNGGVASGDDFATSLLPLRGGKGYQWEGGIRVPLLIHVPWLNPQAKKDNTPVNGADYYPTILDLAGLNLRPEEHIDGVSLRPILEGKKIEDRPIFWHYPHYGNQGGDPSSIVRLGDWKLIYYHEDQVRELYNLAEDREEKENLAERFPDKLKALDSLLQSRLKETRAQFPVPNPSYDEQVLMEKIEKRRTGQMPYLENRRMQMLSPDWQPNEDWWGSLPLHEE